MAAPVDNGQRKSELADQRINADQKDMKSDDSLYFLQCVKERNAFLLQYEKHADCSFLVGDMDNQRLFNVHRLMLSAASKTFDAMLYGSMRSKDAGEPIIIDDIAPRAFEIMLNYIYMDATGFDSFDEAYDTLILSNKYDLVALKGLCVNYMKNNLSHKNALKAFELSHIDMDHIEALILASEKLIKTSTTKILKEACFLDARESTLMFILEQNMLNVSSEMVLFEALEQYASFRYKALKIDSLEDQFMREAVKKIRFLSMNSMEFVSGPAISPLLHPLEAFAILVNIITPSQNVKEMPNGFNILRSRRTRIEQSTNHGIINRAKSTKVITTFPTYEIYRP